MADSGFAGAEGVDDGRRRAGVNAIYLKDRSGSRLNRHRQRFTQAIVRHFFTATH